MKNWQIVLIILLQVLVTQGLIMLNMHAHEDVTIKDIDRTISEIKMMIVLQNSKALADKVMLLDKRVQLIERELFNEKYYDEEEKK